MLEFVAFACGAMIMILEMVGARVLAPHLGSSVIIWTSIIGVMLGFMSLGYWLGGRLSDKRPEPQLLCRILLGAGTSVLVMALLQRPVLELLAQAKMNLYLAAVVASIFLFAVPSTLLGMSSPFILRLKLHLFKVSAEKSGAIIGRFYAISTLGSILGTFLGGFVLVSIFGSSEILFGLAAALFVLPVLVWRRAIKMALINITMCAVIAFLNFSFIYELQANMGLVELDTAYGHLQVNHSNSEDGELRTLSTGPRFLQSAMLLEQPFNLVFQYTKFYDLTFLYQPEPKSILMLGGGAYSVPKHLLSLSNDKYPKDSWPSLEFKLKPLSVDVVEIDPGMTELASKYFELPNDPNLKIIHQDARYFLNTNTKKYDLIFSDVFSSAYSVPFQMATVETAKLAFEQLNDDGICMINTIGSIDGAKSLVSKAMLASYAAVFPKIEIFASKNRNDNDGVQNIMIMAFKNPKMQMTAKADYSLTKLYEHSRISHLPAMQLEPSLALSDNFAPVEKLIIPVLSD